MRVCLTSVSVPLTDSHAISPTPKTVNHVLPQYVKQQSKHSQSLIKWEGGIWNLLRCMRQSNKKYFFTEILNAC